ncbi:MAG: beta-aspartyl-peptidase, partial [Clostridia bacterium]|nr:beta-aspartyl-peptidase [Clostridia bacterium]
MIIRARSSITPPGCAKNKRSTEVPMLTLLKNADLYTPEHLGVRDVLLCGGKIARIAPALPEYGALPDVTVYDAQGARVIPGLIDLHIHITGGGGEQGAPSRVPEIMLSQLTENGVTTVLGLLGTDGYTRSVENLLYKANALTAEGITCYLLTGSYQYPSPSLTGSVARDIMMLTPCVGVKVALSDHRSSNLTPDELVRLASDARVAGLLSGKAGLVVLHMGSGKNRMEYILRAVDETDIPVRTFLQTH